MAVSKVFCEVFKMEPHDASQMRSLVFMPLESIKALADCADVEYWGHNYNILCKYLDSMWKLQLTAKSAKLFTNEYGKQLIFHSNLYFTKNNTPNAIYIMLYQNNDKLFKQKWNLTTGKYIFN